MTDKEDDDDLYNDLIETADVAQVEELRGKVEYYVEKMAQMETKIKTLTSENDEFQKKNMTLKRNISILYKTAMAEGERKDRRIEKLLKEIDELKQGQTRRHPRW